MYKTEQFIQSSILLILLSGYAAEVSLHPFPCLMLAGLLMVLFAIRCLSEQQCMLLVFFQTVLSVLFAVLTDGLLAYLIFNGWRIEKGKLVHVLIPGCVYGVLQIMFSETSLPEVICNVLILTVISAVIYLIGLLTMKYLSARSQIDRAVAATAVSEMYEKKLNRELIIKNYLTDKNARLEERETISRNIHNSVGHSITAAIMALDAADLLLDTEPDQARAKMNTANERIHTSLESIRHAVRVLDKENECIGMDDLISELESVADNFIMDTQIRIRLGYSDIDRNLMLPHEHTEFLTGAVQELLSNGIRHGNADLFTVIVAADSAHIQVSVTDNGESDFDADNMAERIRNGFGLKKLFSYAEKCGGAVNVSNNNGFRTVITLPVLKEYKNE